MPREKFFPRGLTELPYRELLYLPLLDTESVAASLDRFVQMQIETGELDSRLRDEVKGNDSFLPDLTLLSYCRRYSEVKEKPWRLFYFDAPYALILAERDFGSDNAACLSFSIVNDRKLEELFHRNMVVDKVRLNDLIVEQIQGPNRPYHYKSELLLPYRWEVILLGLVGTWALGAGFPRILLQPAENNEYFLELSEQDQTEEVLEAKSRYRRRYNGTAKRCGFKREGRNQPYVLNFIKGGGVLS